MKLTLRPMGLLSGEAAAEAEATGLGRRLAGGRLTFTTLEVVARHARGSRRAVVDVVRLDAWIAARPPTIRDAAAQRLDLLCRPRRPFAGLSPDRPRVMAIINLTPDSFSDGGRFLEPAVAVDHARACLAAGADLIDLGAESTRPGARPVAPDEEAARLLPVLTALVTAGIGPVSVDTRHAAVMAAALAAGAVIVNDVSALRHDPASAAVVAARGASAVLMHMQGDPTTMQQAPRYHDAPLEVFDFLEQRIAACEAAGVPRDHLLVDPGICFGKSEAHNLQLLETLALFHGLGCGVLVGVSRKGITGELHRSAPPPGRWPGTLAAGLAAWNQGVPFLRVHDVAETVQARTIWQSLHPDR
ncbi:MAG: dihydropteroate synthase [Azospirillum sp.]|nr:dihydropteroate synthase [Azospirillum sp.]